MHTNHEQKVAINLVWGGTEIAKVIHRSPRTTYHLLESGQLPAKKVGGRWVAERGKLIAFFLEDATEGAQ